MHRVMYNIYHYFGFQQFFLELASSEVIVVVMANSHALQGSFQIK